MSIRPDVKVEGIPYQMGYLKIQFIQAALTGLCANPSYQNTSITQVSEIAILQAESVIANLNKELNNVNRWCEN